MLRRLGRAAVRGKAERYGQARQHRRLGQRLTCPAELDFTSSTNTLVGVRHGRRGGHGSKYCRGQVSDRSQHGAGHQHDFDFDYEILIPQLLASFIAFDEYRLDDATIGRKIM